ncbi:hypothetical protein [Mastigocoleus sp. MO_188.B34]|uniref:hypothetical protein n=1 Tax=Mastigocoleus sp. MO_188.B34 TaxID=3036635 RepID=UPI00260FD333|nr:hypothetical protein [Mastigocoleus sp. MO_188.B34]MDJ0696461.1 hypothetical protein [Mastigocoleus sp. MO_188.B34]
MRREQNVALLPIINTNEFAPVAENSPNLAIGLLTHYSFDLGGYSAGELVNRWRKDYAVSWLRLAIIEALYQGRYKAVSVQQILTLWHRRGQPTYHFNVEFENLICSKLPEDLTAAPNASAFLAARSDSQGTKSHKVTSFPLKNHTSQPVAPRIKAATQKQLRASYESHQYKTSSRANTSPQEKYHQLRSSTQTVVAASKQRYLPSGEHNLSASDEFSWGSQGGMVEGLPVEDTAIQKATKFLPQSDVNRPPIGQFTPEKSDRSELFTSKLRAIVREETG